MKLIAGALITAVLLSGCSGESSAESSAKSDAAVDEVSKQIQISIVKDFACEQWQAGLLIKPRGIAMTDMALTQFSQLSDLDPELKPITVAAYELQNIVSSMDTVGATPELTAALAKVWAVVKQFCLSDPK